MNRMRQLGYKNKHSLAYQSRVGPVEWLRPYTDDTIRELAAGGVRELVVVPISFVSEHIETLEEIDCEYKQVAMEAGVTGWQRVPALGLEADFIDDLAEAVLEVLPGMEKPPKSDINEGRPVSLRVVNDLVQLRGKEEEIEYGPVRYEVRSARSPTLSTPPTTADRPPSTPRARPCLPLASPRPPPYRRRDIVRCVASASPLGRS